MTSIVQNDVIRIFFSFNPILMGLLVWVWGWGSLLLVATRTHSISTLLKHPGFIIGDFFMLPISAALMNVFYNSVRNPVPMATSSWWTIGMGLLSLILAIISAYRSGNYTIWWWPHSVFYWFMSYMILVFIGKGAVQLVLGQADRDLWFLWVAALIPITVHLILPLIFGPKILPPP